MVYGFQCRGGHTFDLSLDVDRRDDPQTCECGQKADRLLSTSVTFLGVGSTGKLRNTDSVERLYGAGHVKAMSVQKETAEWLTAIGAADGHTGDAKSACFLPTGEGVREKQAMVKAGVKPPESVTFGLKKEFVDSIGKP